MAHFWADRPWNIYRLGTLASEFGSRMEKQAGPLKSDYILAGLKETFSSMLRVA
jgi:hypothetical protein